ncbi:TIGR00341 family protein [Streptomyces sp. NPDC057623]|uniref:TIGR00341 family protein n=1 Tax=Streptomyces sp. NPDC057623 TaxID=3346187 RepID=UPI00367DA201
MRARVLPASQRRSLEELAQDLDLSSGDTTSKRSAFWTMLTLSSVIAAAGVLTDSTATVIGAMIIAPLSTPIMGIALGSVQRRRNGSVRIVLLACLLVIVIGTVFSTVLPGDYDLLSNSQISGRTSPGLMDLIAALATGFAGAVALARRDVAAVLPGVAIAISLVPPLVVTGVCLGRLSGWLALGALMLFVSNVFALVFGGMVVFAALGYGTRDDRAAGRPARRAYAAMALLFTVVVVPLTANTVLTLLLDAWTDRTKDAAREWLADEQGASVTSVDAESRTMYVHVRAPGDLPPVEPLLDRLDGQIPDGIPVVVDASRGRRIDAGRVGD